MLRQSALMLHKKELEASWARTRAHLKSAFRHLPPSLVDGEEGGSVKQYREWLDHNEFELALDELEMLAEANAVQRAFWESMLSAADEMKLTDHAERYRVKISD